MVPENVQKTKRIFPYLYSKYFTTKDIKAMKKIFEDFIAEEDKRDDSAHYYNEATKMFIRAYSSYCDENYPLSCTSFRDAIPYWKKYCELNNMAKNVIDYSVGVIKLLQGFSAIEFDYDYAKQNFNDSIGCFYGDYAYYTYYSHCAIAEIYYRRNEITLFIDYMKSINVPLRENIGYSNLSIVTGGKIMQFEYDRLSKPFVYCTAEDLDKRKQISELIAWSESVLPNDFEGAYVRKTFIRYKELMAKNSLEIKTVDFSDNSTSNDYYIKLKKHEDDELIQSSHWWVKENPNDNTVKLEVQPIAVARNNKIKINIGISALGSPSDIISEYKLTGYDITNKIGFNMVSVKKNKNITTIECESDKEISKTVGTVLLDIKWHLIKPERKKNSSIVKDFFLGSTQHTIYVVRKYIEEPCYWKIVEHTCNWMKNLSESDLNDDDIIVRTIWNNCSITNLSNLNYCFLKALPTGDTLAHLLKEQNGGSNAWADFLIQAFECQGINNSSIYKLNFEAVNLIPGSTERQKFKYNKLCIGNYTNNNEF